MTLIVGDIHGCYDELEALLDVSGIGDDEPIIALGDLFDKGEQPAAVLDFFLNTPQARSIRGNHEQRHLDIAAGRLKPPAEQIITRRKLGQHYDKALHYMETMPLTIELDEAMLLHGYYEAHVPLADQKPAVLLGQDAGLEHLEARGLSPWYQTHDCPKPIICGHKDYSGVRQPFIMEGRIYGLDTRCVYGGSLTALRLPQWQMISVPARGDHWAALQAKEGLL